MSGALPRNLQPHPVTTDRTSVEYTPYAQPLHLRVHAPWRTSPNNRPFPQAPSSCHDPLRNFGSRLTQKSTVAQFISLRRSKCSVYQPGLARERTSRCSHPAFWCSERGNIEFLSFFFSILSCGDPSLYPSEPTGHWLFQHNG